MFVKIQMILMIKTSISNNRLSRLNKSKLYESVRKSLNRYIYILKSRKAPGLTFFYWPSFFFYFISLQNLLVFRSYCTSTRVEIFSTRVETFHIIAFFFNTVYRVEMSTRDESPYNRPLKFEQWAVSVCFVAWFWKMY